MRLDAGGAEGAVPRLIGPRIGPLKASAGDSLEELAADAPALVAAFLTRSRTTHLFVGALDGTLTRCNGVAADALGVPATGPLDAPIGRFLVAHDQDALRSLLASGRRRHRLRLNFVGASQLPSRSSACWRSATASPSSARPRPERAASWRRSSCASTPS